MTTSPTSAADPRAEAKRRAAVEAVGLIQSGSVIGLGTGSTAAFVVEEVGRRLADGRLEDIVAVPTSEATERQARALGIRLSTLDEHPTLALTIDGADEVDPAGNLIKGLGGAFLREKIVALASAHLVIVVDETKLVSGPLGLKAPLPVEVARFGHTTHLAAIRNLGAEPTLRTGADGQPYLTDEGHYIYHCRFVAGIPEPELVERTLKARAGVVETGLFLGFNPRIVVGRA